VARRRPARAQPAVTPAPARRAMTAMVYDFLATPIGRLLLSGDAAGLRCIAFEDARQAGCIGAGWRRDAGALRSAREQLAAWFAGELTVFDIALAPQGTPFQRAVWAQLQRLPYAGTISYGELAQRLGRPAARRAVGAANGANPCPSLCLAIASSAPMASSPASVAASRSSAGCCSTSAAMQRHPSPWRRS